MRKQKYDKRLILWISAEMIRELDVLSSKTQRGKSELAREAIGS